MRALRVHGWGEPPRLERMDPPRPAAGRTLVAMAAATVGHIDRTVWRGAFLRHPPLPYVPGVEAAGVVIAGGALPAGTRVWLRGQGLGTAVDGTWREVIDAPDAAVALLPDGVPFELGAAFFSPAASAWVALHEVGRVRAGERVLVTGATGAVGSLAVQLAREAGARVEPAGGAAGLRDDAPAGLPGDAPAGSPGDAPADLLIDTVGGEVLRAALARVAPGGRAVLVGYAGGDALALDLPAFLQRDVALLPLNMLRREPAGRAAAPHLLERLADGRLHLAVRTFGLDEARAALDWIATRGHRGRAVLVARPGTDRMIDFSTVEK